jgi:hypothetical protein
MKVLILDAAGKEFVRRVVKLQRQIKRNETRQVVSKQILESAIDAGSLCADTQSAPISAKRIHAQRADEAVKRTLFLLDVMQSQGYITDRQAAPVRVLGWEMLNTLRYYINNVTYAAQPAPEQKIIVYNHNVPAPAPAPQTVEQDSDDEGFYEDYIG